MVALHWSRPAAGTADINQQTRLQEPKILARLGFLYEGYSMAYWETFQMVLKLLLAAVPVFVPAQPYGSTQARR